MSFRRIVLGFLLIALVGCQALGPTPLIGSGQGDGVTAVQSVQDTSVQGRVDFESARATQATPGDVVNSATVSFIDTASNQTVATGKTDAAGAFSLTLGGYTPVNGATYLLEAVKGLNSQAPGSDAARFRTILKWNGTAWLSCTNGTSPGSIVINSLTTALSIETALDAANVPAASTIGKVNVATTPASLNANPTYPNHPNSEIAQLAADLLSYLGADADPLASVPAIAPSIASFQPTSGGASSLMRIVGTGFNPAPSGNTVTFNGTGAQVLLATPTSLVVVVPAGATSGTIRVVTGRGSVNSGTPFAIVAGIGSLSLQGFTPIEGHAGDKVTLTGEFGTVQGAVTLNGTRATVKQWTASSLEVVVPFGTPTGAWTVQVGSATATSAQVFKVLPGDVGAFRFAYDQTAIPFRQFYGGNKEPVVIGRYVYLLGNYDQPSDTWFADVLRATIRSDGSWSSWQRVGSMTAPSYHHSTIRIGNWLYVTGVFRGDGPTVQRAAINPDDTLGPFQNYSTMVTGRHAHRLAIVGNYLYVLGGWNTPPVERALIQANGDLGPFENIGSLPRSVTWPTCHVSGNRIYLMGGYDGTNYRADTMVVNINPDGTLGAITTNPSNMASKRYVHGLFTYNGAIYNVGGYDSATYSATVERCVVNPDGTLSAGTIVGRMVTGRYVVTPVVSGNRVYVYGGYDGRYLHHMEVAELNPDGTMQPFRAVGSNLGTWGQAAVLLGDKLYKLGGHAPPNTQSMIEQATIFPDGGVSPFRQIANMTTPRYHFNAVRIGNYLYVIGGYGGSESLRSVERAVINPDNSLGAFVPVSQSLVYPRYACNSKVIGNYLYVTGGHDNRAASSYDSIERALINPDGSLGDFEIYQGSKLLAARSSHGFVGIGDYCYVFGGHRNGTYLNTVEQAKVLRDGSIGPFVAHNPLPIISHGHDNEGFAVLGNYLYLFGGFNNATADARVMRAPIQPDGNLSSWQVVGELINQPRWHHSVVASDSHVYLLNGLHNGMGEGRVEVASWR